MLFHLRAVRPGAAERRIPDVAGERQRARRNAALVPREAAHDEIIQRATSECIADLIKLYLRELPNDLWADVRDGGGRAAALLASPPDVEGEFSPGGKLPSARWDEAQLLVRTLPCRESELIVWVCELMVGILARAESNNMHAVAIAHVFAPILLWVSCEASVPSDIAGARQFKTDSIRLTLLLLGTHAISPLIPNRTA